MGLLDLSYINAGSHEQAMKNIQSEASAQDIQMRQDAQKFTQDLVTQRIKQAQDYATQARRTAAQELGNLVTRPGDYYTGDVAEGWNSNYLAQLTPTSVANGAASRAASHVAEMQNTLSLGVVKDLSDLMKG